MKWEPSHHPGRGAMQSLCFGDVGEWWLLWLAILDECNGSIRLIEHVPNFYIYAV
jgi:hypothetical protein